MSRVRLGWGVAFLGRRAPKSLVRAGLIVLAVAPILIFSASAMAAPLPPSINVAAGPGAGQLTINVNSPVSGATSYNVYESTTSGGENYAGPPACTISASGGLDCTVSGLTAGQTYYFTAEAVSSSGNSLPSNQVLGAPPTGPSGPTITATAASSGQVTITVTGTVSGASSYYVYQGTTSGGEDYESPVCSIAAGVSPMSCTVSGTVGQTLYFTAEALAGSTSAPSAEVSATIPPAPPTITAAAGPSAGEVTVTIATPASGATSYNVYDGTSAGGESYASPACTVTASASPLTCAVSGLSPAQKYYFTAESIVGSAASAPSTEVSAIPEPSAPTITAVAGPGSGQVTLTVTGTAAGASSYKLYQGTSAGGESYASPVCTLATTSSPLSCVLSGLTAGQKYYFTGETVGAGNSTPSTEVNATPQAGPAAPAITATAGPGDAQLTITIKGAVSGASSYKVYEGTTAGAEDYLSPVCTIAAASSPLSCVVSGLTDGQTYFFTVETHPASGIDSAPSAEASATVLTNVVMSPTSLLFGPTAVGSVSSSRAVVISNPTPAVVTVPVGGVALAGLGTDADQFKISDDGCSGQSIPAGGWCVVGVRFAPTISGPAEASLRVLSNTGLGVALLPLSGGGLPTGVNGLSFSTRQDPLFASGSNANGQLGNGGTVSASTPEALAPGSGSFVAASVGGAHSLALRADGTVWAWGSNASGQLGNGTAIDAHNPVQVTTPSGAVAVAAGASHSLALGSDGTVWAWGYNASGQLGNGTTANSSLPLQVSNLSNVVAIAAGGSHSLALRSDGTVWAWGSNAYGQLGNGTTTTSDLPVQVKSLTGVVAIAAGKYHSLALKSDGTVWAWGYNAAGQLGNGGTTTESSPVQVSGITTAVGIAAGGSHSLALLKAGTVDAWGSDSNGQLGNNSITNSTAPVAISGLSAIVQIGAGQNHSLAINSSGQAWAWGQNSSGQLGNGNTTDQHVPVQITALGDGAQALASGSQGNESLIIGQPHTALSNTGPISFTSPGLGSSSTSLVETVTNNGSVPLQFGQAEITGADGDEFQITGDGCSNTTVAPGGSCSIGLRYNEKVSETNPVATLRVVSNSPTSPDLITLDPPASASTAPTSAATSPSVAPAQRKSGCAVAHASGSTLTLRCTVPAMNGKNRARVRLSRGAKTYASATKVVTRAPFTIKLRFVHGLHAGRYTVTFTIAHTSQKGAHAARLFSETLRVPHLVPRH